MDTETIISRSYQRGYRDALLKTSSLLHVVKDRDAYEIMLAVLLSVAVKALAQPAEVNPKGKVYK